MAANARHFGVLIWVSTLITVAWGLSCQTTSQTTGECVEPKECSKWNQMLSGPYISRSEYALYNDALKACADSNGTSSKKKTACCALEDIYKKKVEVEPKCLLGAPSAKQSGKTSFGVFLNIRAESRVRRCVGSLISEKHVLTSARCVYDIEKEDISVYVNAKYVNGAGYDVERSVVKHVLSHKSYNPDDLGHDIALLQLNEKVDLDSPDSPYSICIPTAEEHYYLDNSILHSFGWGANAEGEFSDIKLSVTLQRITLDECVEYNKEELPVKSEVLTRSNYTNPICTIGISGHDLFEGYSGAPLMYRKNGAWFLIGVVGEPLEVNSIKPVISTSVQSHEDWIKEVLAFTESEDGVV